VLSTDALVAALLGALAEVEGGRPHFAQAGEAPRDAVRRVRPRLLLVDCDPPGGCDTAVIGPATMMGATVVLFGRPAHAATVRECASRLGVVVLAMPPTLGALRALLDGAARP
jgi:hypothetical protein